VKSRLSVLSPSSSGNCYDEFNIVPPGLTEKLNQGKVLIKNWHALNWETEERLAKKKGVDKRGAKSNEAYVREVLGEMANAHGIIVINDEAHHAWRIHACYDFSATPFAPSGKKSSEEALFPWILSDFGLNDAIESGLVKTPRVVIRDDGVPDAKDYRSRLYHIYEHVRDDLNRDAQEHDPFPDLVINGYYLLGKDWLEAEKAWKERGSKTPPVMISVANRTETAARVKYAFDHKKIRIDELCDPERILHIDSEVLGMAELAPFVEGKPDFAGISEIDLNDLDNKFRMQRIIFETARDIYDHSYHPEHEQGSASYLEGNPI
jgi:type III restriction enzyme